MLKGSPMPAQLLTIPLNAPQLANARSREAGSCMCRNRTCRAEPQEEQVVRNRSTSLCRGASALPLLQTERLGEITQRRLAVGRDCCVPLHHAGGGPCSCG